jgi:hypothetical protein
MKTTIRMSRSPLDIVSYLSNTMRVPVPYLDIPAFGAYLQSCMNPQQNLPAKLGIPSPKSAGEGSIRVVRTKYSNKISSVSKGSIMVFKNKLSAPIEPGKTGQSAPERACVPGIESRRHESPGQAAEVSRTSSATSPGNVEIAGAPTVPDLIEPLNAQLVFPAAWALTPETPCRSER